MGDFVYTALIFGAGLFVGWVLLPAPKFITDWWKSLGISS